MPSSAPPPMRCWMKSPIGYRQKFELADGARLRLQFSRGYYSSANRTLRHHPTGRIPWRSTMSDILLTIPEIDERIAAIRENLRELIEQATAYSGAADEELASERIAEQEEELERLLKRRDELSGQKS